MIVTLSLAHTFSPSPLLLLSFFSPSPLEKVFSDVGRRGVSGDGLVVRRGIRAQLFEEWQNLHDNQVVHRAVMTGHVSAALAFLGTYPNIIINMFYFVF